MSKSILSNILLSKRNNRETAEKYIEYKETKDISINDRDTRNIGMKDISMKKATKVIFMSFIIACSSMLTGCWDSVEINRRHVVLEVAIDKNQEADTENPYEITYTIPNIAKLTGRNSIAEDIKTSVVTKSKTIGGSIDDVDHRTQNTVSFAHTKAIVIGREILEDKALFEGVLDGLIRNMQVARGTMILAVDGKAKDITQSSVGQNPMMGLYIMKYFNNPERPVSYAKQQSIGNIMKEIDNSNITTIPVIKNKDDKVLIQGAAVVKDYKLVNWLDKDQVKGELFVEGKVNEAPIIVNYRNHDLTYNIDSQNAKINFEPINGSDSQLEAVIEIEVTGGVVEYSLFEGNTIFEENSMKEINQLIQKQIEKEVMQTVDYAKGINVDFLNIGLQMYRSKPDIWENYKNSWEQEGFKNIPVRVKSEVVINNTGVLK